MEVEFRFLHDYLEKAKPRATFVQFPPFVSWQSAVEETQRQMYRAVLRPRPGGSTENQPEGRLEEPAPEECVTAAKANAARVSTLRCSEYARTDAEDFS